MSAIVLVSGRLLRDPQKKVSAKGRPYGSALVRVSDGNDSALWRVTAFSETALAELMKLRVGDGIAATGPDASRAVHPRWRRAEAVVVARSRQADLDGEAEAGARRRGCSRNYTFPSRRFQRLVARKRTRTCGFRR